MLIEDKEIPELYQMKHRHDSGEQFVDWGNNILIKSLSPHIFKNDRMNEFLLRIQKMTSILFDQQNVVKNLKNYIVDKYYYKQAH